MASQQQLNTAFSRVFFADIDDLYPRSERQYDCAGISDIHYSQLGVLRCLSSSVTGQEFLQYHADQNIAAIKRSTADALRYGAAKGRKVMLAWDKACIDYRHWSKLKHTYGIYFTTCEKSNSAAEICSPDMLDRSEPRNQGVVSDHLVGTSNGVQLRRIVYTNPEDGVTYTYLTNDFTLPAYLIVLLYKHRWDIEKIFHQLKSKMRERKHGPVRRRPGKSHALFECIAHNLLLLFERHIETAEGLRDEVEEKKQAGRTKAKPGIVQMVRNFINSALTRATQRTQRFIRWVRVRLYQNVPWSESVARLREIWTLPA